MTATAERGIAELPPLKGFYRTPFGFYVPDHKSPAGKSAPDAYEWLYREGTPPIPNTYWSMVATLPEGELERIENPEIREETRRAQRLMLGSPSQFVGLFTVGNRYLFEPHGFGAAVLAEPLRNGHIEVYDHDVRRIRIGEPQEQYKGAKLWIDESANEDSARYALRGGRGPAGVKRFDVVLHWPPWSSLPPVAGLGFIPEGNTAYVGLNVNELVAGLEDVGRRVEALKDALK